MPSAPKLVVVFLLPLFRQAGSFEPRTQEVRVIEASARVTPGHTRMVRLLASLAERADRDDPYVGTAEVAEARAALEGAPLARKDVRWQALCRLGMVLLRVGRNEDAVATLQQASELEPALAGVEDPRILHRARFGRALAWMRLGEAQNCVARHTSESCILPIGSRGVHVDPEGSRQALALLEELLREDPDDGAARWILNLAHMTLGEYPDGVPERFRIPPSAFASDEAFPRFVDVAPELGLNDRTLAGGVIADDFDGDDVLDLVVSNMHPAGQLEFFHGEPGGAFTRRTREAGLIGILGGLNVLQADYDNDGALDVLVLRGAWSRRDGGAPSSLLRNDGHARFSDVTFEAGLAEVAHPTQTAAWADYDLDGDLDLYVGNESGGQVVAPGQLFRNDGHGRFRDVAAEAGVTNDRYAKGVAWGDYDDDGRPDLYVSNLGQENRLYRNRGDGTFEDVAVQLGVERPRMSFPVWFFDYDNDGRLDLFVATYDPRLGPYVRELAGGRPEGELPHLYHGGPSGFEEVGARLGLAHVVVTMGANYGDLDNDGYLDFYLGTGFPAYEALMPNRMFHNRAGAGFADVTTAGGFGHLQKGHGIAFADLDGDGDQDVFAEMGGAYSGDAFGNALFRNPGTPNHAITLVLVGRRSNRCAIGARIRCVVVDGGVERSIYRQVCSGGSFGASPLRQSLGLGRAERVERIEIRWPATGEVQIVRDVPAGVRLCVTEGEEGWQLRR